MATFHEATQITDAAPGQSGTRMWTAVHVQCGGPLQLVNGDWRCDECKVDFHDDFCADVAAEERDRAAREAFANAATDDKSQKKAIAALEKERANIRHDLLKKREAIAKLRAENPPRSDPAPVLKAIAAAPTLSDLRDVVDSVSGGHWSEADADALRAAVNARVAELKAKLEPAAPPATKPPPPAPAGADDGDSDTRSPLERALGLPKKK